MDKILTYDEFIALAKENYCKGGDSYYECWGTSEFNEYVDMFGPITKRDALSMFHLQYEIDKEYRATAWW